MEDTKTLLKEIDLTFPFVDKPKGLALSYHKVDCFNCEMVRQDMEAYPDQSLPPEALRYLHCEMSCLSAKGWRWALPSYLRYCVEVDDTYDGLETEFLIYNLGPDLKYQKETIERLSALEAPQLECLIHFLEWCSVHPHWSEYCSDDIAKAIRFLSTVLHNRGIGTDRPSGA